MRLSRMLRNILKQEYTVLVPICPDPLAARVAKMKRFKVLALGGYALGAKLCVSEPLLTMTEVVTHAKYIVDAVNLPVLVDGNAGFGEPIQVMRTVRELIKAGAAGISIEDQVYPKRAHYHRDYKEHTISKERMVDKLNIANRIRKSLDKDFLIIARTDSLKTDAYKEALARIEAYMRAGADMVMLFPNDLEEARRLPKDTKAPLVYVNSIGNRVERPVLSLEQAKTMGYRMLRDAISSSLASFTAYNDLFMHLRETGSSNISKEQAVEIRKELEDILGLPELYRIEEETNEKSLSDQ